MILLRAPVKIQQKQMKSKTFNPKNLRQPISCYEESTWHVNGEPVWENDTYSVWNDRFPVTPGHLLWIPKKNNIEYLQMAYGAAFEHGQQQIQAHMWDGFNIGQNIGLAAGQTVLWPHIHLIPRHNGDCEPGRNGIRLSYPNGDHKEYY